LTQITLVFNKLTCLQISRTRTHLTAVINEFVYRWPGSTCNVVSWLQKTIIKALRGDANTARWL